MAGVPGRLRALEGGGGVLDGVTIERELLGEACQQLRLGVDEVQPDQAPRVGEQLAQLGHGDVVSFLHAVAPGSALHHAHGDSIPPVRPDRSTSVCRRRKVRTYPAKALDEA